MTLTFVVCLLFALSTAVPPAAVAQDKRMPIFVESDGGDPVGEVLVYRVREELRRSTGYTLVPARSKAVLRLIVRTLDPATLPQHRGSQTAAAFILVVENDCQTLLGSGVTLTGSERTSAQAESMVAYVDSWVSAWRR